jgi:hypothetical protein
MAKQSNIIQFEGQIGGISFYERKGKAVARKVSGPSKEKIMTSPSYAVQRKYFAEFGCIAIAVGLFFTAIEPLNGFWDKRLVARVRKMLSNFLKQSTADLGKRVVQFSIFRNQLRNLELNENEPLRSCISAPFSITHVAERNAATVAIANMVPSKALKGPEQATHARITHFLTVLSDTVFNDLTSEFQALESFPLETSKLVESQMISVTDVEPVTITLEAALPAEVQLTTETNVLQCIGIQYFKKVNNNYEPIFEKRAAIIADVF